MTFKPLVPDRKHNMREIACYIRNESTPDDRAVMVEVGSYGGESAAVFAELFGRVYCVDAWDVTVYPPDADDKLLAGGTMGMLYAEEAFDEVFNNAGNIIKLKMTSERAHKLWDGMIPDEDQPAGFVYLDAAHDYDSVANDIMRWRQRTLHWIGGHDYNPTHKPGVVRAVNELFGRPDVTFSDSSWIKRLT